MSVPLSELRRLILANVLAGRATFDGLDMTDMSVRPHTVGVFAALTRSQALAPHPLRRGWVLTTTGYVELARLDRAARGASHVY